MIPILSYLLIMTSVFAAAVLSPATVFAGVVLIKLIDFWGQLSSRYLYEHQKITNVLIVVALGIAIARAVSRHPPKWTGGLQVWWAVLWLWVYGAFSLTWSRAPLAGTEQWSLYLPYMVITLAIPLVFTRTEDFKKALLATIGLGGVTATLVLVFGTWTGRTITIMWNPADGLWDPLAFGQASGFFVIMGALIRWKGARVWMLLKWAAVLVGVVLAARSGSRGQFVLMLAIPGIFVWGYRLQSKALLLRLALLSSMVVGLVGYFALTQVMNQDERWSEARIKEDGQLRIDMISRVMTAWAKDSNSIVLGLGSSASFDPNLVGYYPHVVPLEILAELGIIGFLSFLGVLLYVTKKYVAVIRQTTHDEARRSVGLILGGCFLYTLALSCKQGSMVSFSPIIFTYAILIERFSNLLSREKEIALPDQENYEDNRVRDGRLASENQKRSWPNLIQN